MEKYSAVQFAEENLKTIFAYSLTRVKNREDAEDLAGEIVANLIQNAKKIDSAEHFYGYIWGIAANTLKAFLRKRAKNSCVYSDEAFEETRILPINLMLRMKSEDSAVSLRFCPANTENARLRIISTIFPAQRSQSALVSPLKW